MNAYKAYKKATAVYDKVKADHPLNTTFTGDLQEVVENATDHETFVKIQGFRLDKDIDGLLDFLYGMRALNNYTFFDRETVNKLITAIEVNCKS